MKRILVLITGLISFALVGVMYAGVGPAKTAPDKTIGIVMPLDHAALRAIVSGFEESRAKLIFKSQMLSMT